MKWAYFFQKLWNNPGVLGEPVFWIIVVIGIVGIIVYKNSNKK